MAQSDQLQLSAVLGSLAAALLTADDLREDLNRITRLACELLPGCSGASVSLLVDGVPTTAAVTDHVALEVDMVQYDNGEGPCLASLGGDVVRVGFVPEDERFPHFAVGAADRRVMSVLSTPIVDDGAVRGSLNLYSREPEAFDAEAEDLALVMAAEAATAIVKSDVLTVASEVRDKLQEQHDESVLVARAQGVLMAVNECSAAHAAALIGNAADQNGERIIRTAERILTTVETTRDQGDASAEVPRGGSSTDVDPS
jgi:GAF domain-containing protein